jgi:hypothetical protein
MIQQVCQHVDEEIATTTTQIAHMKQCPQREFVQGIRRGEQLIRNSLQEAILLGGERGNLALSLEDLSLELEERVHREESWLSQGHNIQEKASMQDTLGFISALRQGALELREAADIEWQYMDSITPS